MLQSGEFPTLTSEVSTAPLLQYDTYFIQQAHLHQSGVSGDFVAQASKYRPSAGLGSELLLMDKILHYPL